MKKNVFDRISDSYDNFHLKSSEINIGNDTVSVSPKLKLLLGWSLFILLCVLGYIIIGNPFAKQKEISQKDKEAVLDENVDVNEEHDTIIPYEKDADKELNTFIEDYFNAITACDNLALQDMVTDSDEYKNADTLRQKAEFITGYSNITVYTKEGLDEGSYIAFVVANISISGVNSSPYDIMTLYIVNGARGYLVNNGAISKDMQDYIEKVKGDEDIQKIYRSIEKQNNALKDEDPSLKNFFDMLSGSTAQQQETVSGDASGDVNGTTEMLPEDSE